MSMSAATPQRILLGPGPSDAHPRVLQAMAKPLIGHLDPAFIELMDHVQYCLRVLFGTESPITLPMSGTGSAGMETVFVNAIEPGDRVVIGVNGLFGERMCDVAARCGAEVVAVNAPWGEPLDPDDLRRVADGAKLIAVVHAETSTGVLQPLKPIREVADDVGAMLLVDCVTSLGGMPVDVDAIGIDLAYSGTQKCLSCPPGLAPVALSERALQALQNRKTKVASWYLDLTMLIQYWASGASGRFYHHTAPISMIYALAEALDLIMEEGLEARYERHKRLGNALQAGLTAMGLELFAREGYRLPMLTSVRVPEGLQEAQIRRALLDEYGVEIGGGLGQTQGKIWRIGLMGHSCQARNVVLLLTALGRLLTRAGIKVDFEAGIVAATQLL